MVPPSTAMRLVCRRDRPQRNPVSRTGGGMVLWSRVLVVFLLLQTTAWCPGYGSRAVMAIDTAAATETHSQSKVQIKRITGCETLHTQRQQRTPPAPEYWNRLRDAYVDVMGPERSTIAWPLPPEEEDAINTQTDLGTGVLVPIAIRTSITKGRGVYATQFIKQGDVVWQGRYHAEFRHDEEHKFQEFLSKVTWEQACDLLQWCYGHDYDDEDDNADADEDDNEDDDDEDVLVGVACCLDEGSLFNHGEQEEEDGSAVVVNVGYRDPEYDVDMIALTDIQPGDELIQDYDTFDYDLPWFEALIDVGWTTAWRDTEL